MTDSTELKECPFCGGEAQNEIAAKPGKDWGDTNPITRVWCKQCLIGTRWQDVYDDADYSRAVILWNTRTPKEAEG